MRSTLLILALSALPAFGTTPGFQAIGTDAAAWSKILGSVGIPAAKSDQAQVIVVGSSSHLDIAALAQNHFVIPKASLLRHGIWGLPYNRTQPKSVRS